MSGRRVDLALYLVTDDRLAFEDVLAQAIAAARAGVSLVQFRAKRIAATDQAVQARRLKSAIAPLGVPLIVNDHLDVALAAEADGLHLGQGDGDPVAARAALGPDAILGLSVTRIEELAQVPDCVDYLGVGPVFATATKADAASPLGLDGFGAICRASRLPCVAIGGIDRASAGDCMRAGAAGIAVVSAVSQAADPGAATAELLRLVRSARGASMRGASAGGAALL